MTSHADLDRQHAMLEAYCAGLGWRSKVIRDLGSGMNYRKKGLQVLLLKILRKLRGAIGAYTQRPNIEIRG
jgi:predicted site-specific integrase-resolvase